MFSGRKRKTSLANVLRQWSSQHEEFDIEVEEWDIANGDAFDLLNERNRSSLMARLQAGEFAMVVMSPPCGTWSRAPWANQFGPRPLRSFGEPWGFPWLEGPRLKKVANSNIFIRFCMDVLSLLEQSFFAIAFLLEHPENLGAVTSYKKKVQQQWFQRSHAKVRPASIWQLPEIQKLAQHKAVFSRVFHQCSLGASSPKPTRILTSLPSLSTLGFGGWPSLSPDGFYQGPLPKKCSCGKQHSQLIAKGADGSFNTTAAAAYPPKMDILFAGAIWNLVVSLSSAPLKRPCEVEPQPQPMIPPQQEGGDLHLSPKRRKTGDEGGAPILGQAGLADGQSMRGQSSHEMADGNGQSSHESADGQSMQWQSSHEMAGGAGQSMQAGPERGGLGGRSSCRGSQLAGRRAQIQVWYKGKIRRVADGLGKCSPGLRPAGSRPRCHSKAAESMSGLFWSEVSNYVDSLGKDERLRLMAKLALGRYQESPFAGWIEDLKEKVDGLAIKLGKNPRRKTSDRVTEINFRRLKALAELVEDEDHAYLATMASRGVPLGVRGEIGKVTSAYDPKMKNEEDSRPPAWEEEMKLADRSNYKSATAHLEMVKEHILDDAEKGWIVEMSREEAVRKFGDELQIASLGAVPKDPSWSDVRVVHDGTHGIQVNVKIDQPNKMEFPQFDDLQAMMGAFQQHQPDRRMLMAFDIKAAHRLVPIQPEDWGLQAFKLEEDGNVWCNTRGTFGVTTASFWWGRVASTTFRVLHRLWPEGALCYLLLFADDGLLMAGGEDYHKLILSLFIFLDLLEIPLSWKKTRGGFKTEWIGYTVDLEGWKIGVSEKKVAWLVEWVKATNRDGRVLGREFRAGVGRMGFLAGAISGARPFLAPLYAMAARVSNTAFVELHMAVRLALEFFADWLRREPMKSPAEPPGVAGEVFRVDAMASDLGICIGGWETYETNDPAKARWFSLTLDRKSCPWLYVRGEPHRTIAASELLAVTVAVVVFGPRAKWRKKHGRLVLSGFTDNASNSYVIDKFLSVKFPVSMVLMELSRQLAELQSELQLHWIPREQNEESDDLSKGKFDAFDPANRIEVDMASVDWKVIPQLMEHAMAFDKELQLRRTSKEDSRNKSSQTSQKTPPEERLRLKQPW